MALLSRLQVTTTRHDPAGTFAQFCTRIAIEKAVGGLPTLNPGNRSCLLDPPYCLRSCHHSMVSHYTCQYRLCIKLQDSTKNTSPILIRLSPFCTSSLPVQLAD
jgi:hypothetical protein